MVLDEIPKKYQRHVVRWLSWRKRRGLTLEEAVSDSSISEFRTSLKSKALSDSTCDEAVASVMRYVVEPAVMGGSLPFTAVGPEAQRPRKARGEPKKKTSSGTTHRNNPVVKVINQTSGSVAARLLGVAPEDMRTWFESGDFPIFVVERAIDLLREHKGKIPRELLCGKHVTPPAYVFVESQNPAWGGGVVRSGAAMGVLSARMGPGRLVS